MKERQGKGWGDAFCLPKSLISLRPFTFGFFATDISVVFRHRVAVGNEIKKKFKTETKYCMN